MTARGEWVVTFRRRGGYVKHDTITVGVSASTIGTAQKAARREINHWLDPLWRKSFAVSDVKQVIR
jgi:hypothetical protein